MFAVKALTEMYEQITPARKSGSVDTSTWHAKRRQGVIIHKTTLHGNKALVRNATFDLVGRASRNSSARLDKLAGRA